MTNTQKKKTLTSDDSLNGLFKVFLVDGVRKVASGDQSRLVTNISDVGAWQTESREKKPREWRRLRRFDGDAMRLRFYLRIQA